MRRVRKIFKYATLIALAIIIADRLINWEKDIDWGEQLEYAIIVFVIALFLTIINFYYEEFISKKFSWESHPNKRLIIGSLGSIIITVLAYGLARMVLIVGYYGNSVDYFWQNEERSEYLIFIVIAIIISLFIHSFHFYKALQESKVKEQKIIAGTASAKFDALKNQLDPHFLFNSLNVLTSLIEEDPNQAQKFTTSLSKVYRYVLEQKNKDLVSVDEELQFAKTYVKLLKMRFEDSIVFDIPEQSNTSDAKIVPLSLQLLLENAVKHNVVTSDRPLHIRVYEKDGMLVVGNNLQEKQVVKKSSGVGLQNIQQRYELLTDRMVSIDKTSTDFKVRIPILTKQVSSLKTQKAYIDEKLYKKAKERVEQIKGFYGNLLAYCIVIPFFAYLNYQTTDFPWVLFPIVGWGIGVGAHGMEAFGYNPLWGKKWEERRIRKYMEDDNF
ncbi:2TM domain-containing protein [Maribacter algicola]|uniref:2TM domain-containing protein n=1 Tax=Meishania litoralis TaxID=3434685 RepID=A0ACC7LM10_9FLAO